MTEQDQARIAAIEKDLNTLINVLKDEMGTNDGVSRFGIKWDRFSPPIAPVEEYVECVAWQGVLNTIAQTVEVEPIKEERWNVSVQPFKHNIKDNRIIIYYNDGNLTSHEAHKISDKIKQLLTTL